MNESILKLDATAQAALIRNKEISPKELLSLTEARCEKVNPVINALSFKGFRKAEIALKNRNTDSEAPFYGVPFFLKDLLGYPGMPLTYGSWLFAQNICSEGSPYTEALDRAGFIQSGRTITSEFGLLGSTETALHGKVKNPWNTEYSAGGSSGGSAAAVASGMIAAAHASDGGGSVRIPAAMNGLFGFKPGRGTGVSTGPSAGEFSSLVIDHCVTRSVRDSHGILTITAKEPERFKNIIRGRKYRIGFYSRTLIGGSVESEISQSVEKAAALCRDLGHVAEEIRPPESDGKAISDYFFALAGKAMSDLMNFLQVSGFASQDTAAIEPFTASLIDWYRSLPDDFAIKRKAAVQLSSENLINKLNEYDILLTPVLGVKLPRLGFLAPHLDRELLIGRTEQFAGFTPIHNIAGTPAMSVPLFTESNGMPSGSHFAAGIGKEDILLDLAYQLEEAFPWKPRLDLLFDKFT